MKRSTFNTFLWLKMPIAKIAGVRLLDIEESLCRTSIRLHRLSQNPFKSIFWAVLGMAAELSTGVLCLTKIRKSERDISMLVVGLKANFTKKAVGKVIFTCDMGEEVDSVLQEVITAGERKKLTLRSVGRDERGEQVAEFYFTWSFKLRD